MAREPLQTEAPRALVIEFLQWVGRKPRTYGEAMEAWGTYCPGWAIWEDATRLGLVQVRPAGGRMDTAEVVLTPSARRRAL